MNTQNLLKIIFGSMIGCSLIVAVLFEGNFLPSGILVGNSQQEFFCTLFMELLTICMIPLALRLIRSGSKTVVRDQDALYIWYRKRAVLRVMMIGLPLFVNTLLYYLFMNVTFGYMALILLICMFFIIPTQARYLKEMGYYSVQVGEIDE